MGQCFLDTMDELLQLYIELAITAIPAITYILAAGYHTPAQPVTASIIKHESLDFHKGNTTLVNPANG